MLTEYIYIWRSHLLLPSKVVLIPIKVAAVKESSTIMLALSPSSWFPTFGWPLDDQMGQEQNQWTDNHDHPFINSYNREIDCSDSFFGISSPQPVGGIDGPKTSPATSEDIPSNLKKMNHNANERDRRKKLNSLYTTLRSLLPVSDQKVGVNISSHLMILFYLLFCLQLRANGSGFG